MKIIRKNEYGSTLIEVKGKQAWVRSETDPLNINYLEEVSRISQEKKQQKLIKEQEAKLFMKDYELEKEKDSHKATQVVFFIIIIFILITININS